MRVLKVIVGFVTILLVLIAMGIMLLPAWDLSFIRSQLESEATEYLGLKVNIDGSIQLAPSLVPRIRIEDVRVANPAWASRSNFAMAKTLEIHVALWPMLKGEVEFLSATFEDVDVLLEDGPDGTDNYTALLSDDSTDFDLIDTLNLRDVTLGYRWPDETSKTLTITEAQLVNIVGAQLRIAGKGTYQESPLSFSLTGGSIHEFNNPTRPWPFHLDLQSVDTSLMIDAQVARPLTWEGAEYGITVKGENSDSLNSLFELSLPETGPYEISAKLTGNGDSYKITDIKALIQGAEAMPDIKVAEGEASGGGDSPIKMVFAGEYADVPFALDFEGGSYVELTTATADWPLQLSTKVADSVLHVRGVLKRSTATLALDTEVSMKGNLSNSLLLLFGVESPVSGPYELTTQLSVTENHYAITEFKGRIEDPKTLGTLVIHRANGSAGGDESVRLNVTGTLRDVKFATDLEGGTVKAFMSGPDAWPIKINTRAAGATLNASGKISETAAGHAFDLRLKLKGRRLASLNSMLDVTIPDLGPYEFSARANKSSDGYTLTDLSARIGKSDIAGDLTLRTAKHRPVLSGNLMSTKIYTDDFFPRKRQAKSKNRTVDSLNLPIDTQWLRTMDASLQLQFKRIVTGNLPLRGVVTTVKLRDGRLVLDPLRATLMGSPFEGEFQIMLDKNVPVMALNAKSNRIDLEKVLATLKIKQAIAGTLERVEFKLTSKGRTPRDLLEHAHLRTTARPKGITYGDKAVETPIPVKINNVKLEALEGKPLKFEVAGRIPELPFRVSAQTSTLRQIATRSGAWPIQISAQADGSTLKAKGKVMHPLEGRGFNLDFDLRGSQPRKLFPLLGFVFPLSGDYRIEGHFVGGVGRLGFSQLRVQVGKSDVAGTLTISTHRRRPKIVAKLVTEKLYLQDISMTDYKQKGEDDGRIIPEFTVPEQALRTMDLELDYSAKTVITDPGTIGNLVLKARLENGKLLVSPLKVTGETGGKINATYHFDVSSKSSMNSIKITARDLNYGLILKRFDVTDRVEGKLDVDISLVGPGISRHQFLKQANGQISIIGGRGKFASRKLDRWAADITTLMLSPKWHMEDVTELNCVVANIEVKDGIAKSDKLIVDTERITIAGSGALNLDTEKLDLLLTPSPKRVSIVSLANPVRVKGPLGSPETSLVKLSKRQLRITAVVAGSLLAGLINPVFIVFAFSDLGTGPGNSCVEAINKLDATAQ